MAKNSLNLPRRDFLTLAASTAMGLGVTKPSPGAEGASAEPEDLSQKLSTAQKTTTVVDGLSADDSAVNVPPQRWVGRWVWCAGESYPENRFLMFRHSFELAQVPEEARFRVTASDRYLLYVNGDYLGRGPARSVPWRKSYDVYDLRPHLRTGKNTIALRPYYYGKPADFPYRANYFASGERAGVWAQIELKGADGKVAIIGTDDSWRMYQAKGWNRSVAVNQKHGWTEVYDANADPVDWMATDFDDSAWEKAAFVAPETWFSSQVDFPWMVLEERTIPMLREQEAFPVRVVGTGEVIDQGAVGQVDIAELLSSEIHLPLEAATLRDAEALLQRDGRSAELRSQFAGAKGIRSPYVIVDFGGMVFGFPRIRLKAEKGAIIDVGYSQQLVGGRLWPILNPYYLRPGDRYITRPGEQMWEEAEAKAFRYLQVTVRSSDSPVWIDSVSVNKYGYPADQRGEFEASDPLLTKLWQAAIYTTSLMMEDTLVCDAFRERIGDTAGWTFDHNGVLTGYGASLLLDRYLTLSIETQRPDGLIRSHYPVHGYQQDFWNAELMWSSAVRALYLFAGRMPAGSYRSVRRNMDWYEPYRDEQGLLSHVPGRIWVDDSSSVDCRGANFASNAMYVKGLEDAAWLAEQVGEKKDATRWRRIAQEVRETLQRIFWNERQGLFEDSFYQGTLTGITSEISNGLALLWGIATEDQSARIGRNLSKPESGLVPASPLTIPYVLDGLFQIGMSQAALDWMRNRFAEMLQAGGDHPTLWESWSPYVYTGLGITDEKSYAQRSENHMAWARSLAHLCPDRVAYVMSTRVLGVAPATPGFRTAVIRPHLGNLTWVRGVVPTPQGDIRIEWGLLQGKLTNKTELPEGVHAEIILPRAAGKEQVLIHSGRKLDLGRTVPLASGVQVTPGELQIKIGPGAHEIELY